MIKKLTLPWLLLLVFNFTLSASSNSADSTDTDDEKLPSNKMELNEIMEDIKKKISELENKSLLYESYEKAVKDFSEGISRFDEQVLNKALNNIESILKINTPDKQKKIFQEETSFLTALNSFPARWNFFTKPEYMDISGRAFFDKTNFPLQKTLSTPMLSQMQRNHYDNLNQTFLATVNSAEDLNEIKDVLNRCV